VECVPFRAAIAADVAFIMTAHILVPTLDEEKPATLSSRIVTGMLRTELGFRGVIVSDDLEMKAIAKTWTVADAAVQAIAAGCDALLVCSGDVDVQAETLEALVHAVEDRRIPWKALEESQKLFEEGALQDEGTARQQAARGTFDPAYLNYTLGKLMIMQLREDWTASHGGRAGWKAFLEYALGLREAGVNHVAFNLKYGRRSARDVLEEIGREVLPRVA
jgi:hypothetical protein